MIKPDFWRDEKIGLCSYAERLMFIALWNFADDNGVGRASRQLIKADAFPYDDIGGAEVEAWLLGLERLGLIKLYEKNGQRYYFIRHFKRHQKINRPTPSCLPGPPDKM